LLVLARKAVLHGVSPARQVDPDRVGHTFAGVILDEPAAQASSLDAHQRVGLRIEICRAAEHLDADRVALQPLSGAGQGLLDDEAQKIRRSSGLLKTTARENSLERRLNFARARLALVRSVVRYGYIVSRSAVGHPVPTP
jgi:hypothetical protein